MAWIYLAESEGSASHYAPGCVRSPIVRSIDTLRACCSPGNWPVLCRALRSGMMCGACQATSSQESILSQPDSHARISALREMAQVWKESEVAYSSKCFVSPMNANQLSFFSKTSLQSQPAEGWHPLIRAQLEMFFELRASVPGEELIAWSMS